MTMQEQELMLFGGWAKALIPPPIDSGVDAPSVTFSVSLYTDTTPMEDPSFNIDQQDVVCLLNEYSYTPRVELSRFFFDVGNQQFIWVDESVDDSLSLVVHWWVNMAFLRFFEIWKKGTADVFIRGLSGTSRLRRSFAGKVGTQSIGKKNQLAPIARLDNKVWALNNLPALYPFMRRLPPSGIQSARNLARLLREQRGNQHGTD
jgi:hypothetical protein